METVFELQAPTVAYRKRRVNVMGAHRIALQKHLGGRAALSGKRRQGGGREASYVQRKWRIFEMHGKNLTRPCEGYGESEGDVEIEIATRRGDLRIVEAGREGVRDGSRDGET